MMSIILIHFRRGFPAAYTVGRQLLFEVIFHVSGVTPRCPSLLTRLQVPIQVALYAALFLIADRLVQQFHLPLPANIVGMLMLLALILLRILPLSWVKAGPAGCWRKCCCFSCRRWWRWSTMLSC